MFAFLRGIVHRKSHDQVVLDVGGVGYDVRIPLSTYYELGTVGEAAALRITTLVRADSIALYGFLAAGEQRLFELLISVSGVGARMALAVLSGMSVPEVAAALVEGDARRLRSIPGVGPKTAGRLVVELGDRVRPLLAAGDTSPTARPEGTRRDVVSALVNLGYPQGQATRAMDRILSDGENTEADFQDLLRETLRQLHR